MRAAGAGSQESGREVAKRLRFHLKAKETGMGARTGARGEEPRLHSEDGLPTEIGRVKMRLSVLHPSNATQRRSLESQLHNLQRE